MKKSSRILGIVLTLVMLVGMLPTMVFATATSFDVTVDTAGVYPIAVTYKGGDRNVANSGITITTPASTDNTTTIYQTATKTNGFTEVVYLNLNAGVNSVSYTTGSEYTGSVSNIALFDNTKTQPIRPISFDSTEKAAGNGDEYGPVRIWSQDEKYLVRYLAPVAGEYSIDSFAQVVQNRIIRYVAYAGDLTSSGVTGATPISATWTHHGTSGTAPQYYCAWTKNDITTLNSGGNASSGKLTLVKGWNTIEIDCVKGLPKVSGAYDYSTVYSKDTIVGWNETSDRNNFIKIAVMEITPPAPTCTVDAAGVYPIAVTYKSTNGYSDNRASTGASATDVPAITISNGENSFVLYKPAMVDSGNTAFTEVVYLQLNAGDNWLTATPNEKFKGSIISVSLHNYDEEMYVRPITYIPIGNSDNYAGNGGTYGSTTVTLKNSVYVPYYAPYTGIYEIDGFGSASGEKTATYLAYNGYLTAEQAAEATAYSGTWTYYGYAEWKDYTDPFSWNSSTNNRSGKLYLKQGWNTIRIADGGEEADMGNLMTYTPSDSGFNVKLTAVKITPGENAGSYVGGYQSGDNFVVTGKNASDAAAKVYIAKYVNGILDDVIVDDVAANAEYTKNNIVISEATNIKAFMWKSSDMTPICLRYSWK